MPSLKPISNFPFLRKAGSQRAGRLVRRNFMISLVLVSGGLLTSGLVQIYYSYNEVLQQLALLQQEKADGAAFRIEQFFTSIEQGLKTAGKSRELVVKGISPDFRFELRRLLSVLPPIMDLVAIPLSDGEAVQVSRFKPVFSIESDDQLYRKTILAFKSDTKLKIYIDAVEFARDSEPHVSIAVSIDRYPGRLLGALFADVDLRYVADVIGAITVGKKGHAYVVTNTGELIAHPDMSLVLARPNVGKYDQVKLAFEKIPAGSSRTSIRAVNFHGEKVFSSFARIPGVNWAVIIEQPVAEINDTIYAILLRTSGLILLGLGIALLASLYVARHVVRPLGILGAGVQRIGQGDLDHRLEIKTGDEIEALAGEFNKMTAQLRDSYATLEARVELRNRQINEALEQQTATSEILRVSASSPTDIQPVLDIVAEKAARLCDARDASIFRLDNGILKRVAVYGSIIPSATTQELIHGDSLFGQAFINRNSPAGRAIVDRKTIHVSDFAAEIETEYPESKFRQQQSGTRTMLVAPLLREGVPIGTINICRTEVRAFSEKQIKLLETFADQAVIAIENVSLFKELEEKTSELETANRELLDSLARQTAVAGTLRVMASSPSNLRAVLDAILSDAARLTKATGGVIRLFDATGTLCFIARYGHTGQFLRVLQNAPLPVDENSVSTMAIRERRAVQIHDIQKEGPEWRGPVEPGPWHTALAVPLLQDIDAIGVIVVFREIVEPFTDQQMNLLTTFADQAVVAIKNSTLFNELQARTREIETANERLRELDKLKSGFVSNVSHELRTPLTAIGSLVDNMLDGLTGTLNAKQTHYVSGIKNSTERLARLIHDLLDLSVIESGTIELKMAQFSLPSLIREVAEVLTPVAQEKSIALVLPSTMTNGDHIAWADRDKITQVLTNLISNAVKFTPSTGKVELGLETTVDGRWLQVGVRDTGPGIPPAETRLIFDEFYQINQPGQEKAKGVGLGLAICKKLVDMHGGHIRVESAVGQGSTFYFTVPAHRKILEPRIMESAQP